MEVSHRPVRPRSATKVDAVTDPQATPDSAAAAAAATIRDRTGIADFDVAVVLAVRRGVGEEAREHIAEVIEEVRGICGRGLLHGDIHEPAAASGGSA